MFAWFLMILWWIWCIFLINIIQIYSDGYYEWYDASLWELKIELYVKNLSQLLLATVSPGDETRKRTFGEFEQQPTGISFFMLRFVGTRAKTRLAPPFFISIMYYIIFYYGSAYIFNFYDFSSGKYFGQRDWSLERISSSPP